MEQSIFGEFFALFQGELFIRVVSTLFDTSPFWLPILLVLVFWDLWIRYIRRKFISERDYSLLEIRLPQEIKKSPLAMEVVFNGFHTGPGETSKFKKYLYGSVRPWWSLELVSLGGKIHFFIWTRTSLKDTIEAQIYAQYPDVQILEVDDYARYFKYEKGKTGLWGCDFALSKADAYPIKTYVDYGSLKEGVKEEEKVDPLGSIIEFLGSLQAHEQVWYQIIIQQTKGRDRKKKGTWFGKTGWKDEAELLVKKLRDETVPNRNSEFPGFPNPTKGQLETMTAIERSITKPGFECGIRGIYLTTDSSKFNGINIPVMMNAFKQYSSNTLNGFYPTRWLAKFDEPWHDFRDILQHRSRQRLLHAYRKRSWFHPPYKTKPFVLNTEELATIFHLPGGVVQTPTLERITSKRGEAPTNLPL